MRIYLERAAKRKNLPKRAPGANFCGEPKTGVRASRCIMMRLPDDVLGLVLYERHHTLALARRLQGHVQTGQSPRPRLFFFFFFF